MLGVVGVSSRVNVCSVFAQSVNFAVFWMLARK